jgi:hypothetical protein
MMDLQDIYPAGSEAPQARLDRAPDRGRHIGEFFLALQPDLGGKDDPLAIGTKGGAEILLRLAGSIDRRGVEEVDTEIERATDGANAVLVARRAVGVADAGTAEADFGDFQAGPAKTTKVQSGAPTVVAGIGR